MESGHVKGVEPIFLSHGCGHDFLVLDQLHNESRYTLVTCLIALAVGIEEYEISYGPSGSEPKVNNNTILVGGKTYFDSTILMLSSSNDSARP